MGLISGANLSYFVLSSNFLFFVVIIFTVIELAFFIILKSLRLMISYFLHSYHSPSLLSFALNHLPFLHLLLSLFVLYNLLPYPVSSTFYSIHLTLRCTSMSRYHFLIPVSPFSFYITHSITRSEESGRKWWTGEKARSWVFERRMNEIIEFARPLGGTAHCLVTQSWIAGTRKRWKNKVES